MPPLSAKQRLRDRLLERRLALEPLHRQNMESRLGDRLEAFSLSSRFTSVAGYFPMRGEVDLRPTMSIMASSGVSVALPCIEPDGRMTFRRWQPETPLTPGKYLIPTPLEGEEMIPQLILLPLLACDTRGYRLGAGGGYYDRTLSQPVYRPCYRLGVGFSFQLLSRLPSEAHDVTLHAFLSETGITEFNKTA